jgi:hypothetical protein
MEPGVKQLAGRKFLQDRPPSIILEVLEMDSIKLATLLLALVFLSIPCQLAQEQADSDQHEYAAGDKPSSSANLNSSFYTEEAPSDPEGLIEIEQGLDHKQERNALWIVDSNASNRQASLTIPPGAWSRMEILPKENGSVTTYERYPIGRVLAYNMGNVSLGCRYIIWFYADTPGNHELWYSVKSEESARAEESNHIEFNVFNLEPSKQQTYLYQKLS